MTFNLIDLKQFSESILNPIQKGKKSCKIFEFENFIDGIQI